MFAPRASAQLCAVLLLFGSAPLALTAPYPSAPDSDDMPDPASVTREVVVPPDLRRSGTEAAAQVAAELRDYFNVAR